MYSETKIAEMISTGSKNLFYFQFLQVKALINRLMTLGNVFRPLTALEQLIGDANKPKLLSKLYDMLLSSIELTDKAKIQWE